MLLTSSWGMLCLPPSMANFLLKVNHICPALICPELIIFSGIIGFLVRQKAHPFKLGPLSCMVIANMINRFWG